MADCLTRDLGQGMGCPPWGSFLGILARIYASFCKRTDGENILFNFIMNEVPNLRFKNKIPPERCNLYVKCMNENFRNKSRWNKNESTIQCRNFHFFLWFQWKQCNTNLHRQKQFNVREATLFCMLQLLVWWKIFLTYFCQNNVCEFLY